MDGAAWKSALVGAAMAGISALKSLAVDLIKQRKTKIVDEKETSE
jgi:hypothetical protein